MPTLQDYPGVSCIWHWFPALLYRSPDLLDQIDFWAFLCFSLNFAHFFPKNLYFFISRFLGHFCTLTRYILSLQWWKWILTVCCSYDVLGGKVNLWPGLREGGCWYSGVRKGGLQCKIESLQILDLQRLASLNISLAWAKSRPSLMSFLVRFT